ncbi:hypothetical protein ACTFIU_001414 [Dictyostelium citrinum]
MSRRSQQSQQRRPPKRDETSSEEEEEEEDVSEEEVSEEEEEVGNKRKRATPRKSTTTTTTTTTTSTQSQQSSSARSAELNDEERHKLVYEYVRLLLFSNRKKLPITKTEINRIILARFKDKSLQGYVYNAGREYLKDIFGYDVVELKKKGKESSTYILKNLNDYDAVNQLDSIAPIESRELMIQKENLTLLTIILSIIFLEGGRVDSTQLFQFLSVLGFSLTEPHPVYGDIEKLLEKFCREQYLSRKKNIVDNETLWEYEVGQRSSTESSERYIVNAISDIYGSEPDSLMLKAIEQRERDEGTFNPQNLTTTRGRAPKTNKINQNTQNNNSNNNNNNNNNNNSNNNNNNSKNNNNNNNNNNSNNNNEEGEEESEQRVQKRPQRGNSRTQVTIEEDEEDEEDEEPPQQSQRISQRSTRR